jgi:hypothetical protein
MPEPDGDAAASQPTRRTGRAASRPPGAARAAHASEPAVPPARRLRLSSPSAPTSPAHADTAPGGAGVFYGQPFAVVGTVEVCFRHADEASNLRAAAAWLEANPGWHLRTLWHERHGAFEIAQYDHGPHAVLWVIAEQGAEDEAAEPGLIP